MVNFTREVFLPTLPRGGRIRPMEDKFTKPPDFMASVINQKALLPRKEAITERYTVKHKVLGLGVNGKVLECVFNQTGEKRALKVSCVGRQSHVMTECSCVLI